MRYPISCSCRSLQEHGITVRLQPPTLHPPPCGATVRVSEGVRGRFWEREWAGAAGTGLQEGVLQEGWGGTCLQDGIPVTASPRRGEG